MGDGLVTRLLLDSHVVIWWLEGGDKIAPPAREAIASRESTVFVSTASIWEMAIKAGNRRLQYPPDLLQVLDAEGFDVIPVLAEHALAVAHLPPIHGDPFDRMLVCQARSEGATIVTREVEITRYGVPSLKA